MAARAFERSLPICTRELASLRPATRSVSRIASASTSAWRLGASTLVASDDFSGAFDAGGVFDAGGFAFTFIFGVRGLARAGASFPDLAGLGGIEMKNTRDAPERPRADRRLPARCLDSRCGTRTSLTLLLSGHR
jgi:hypothetical protein